MTADKAGGRNQREGTGVWGWIEGLNEKARVVWLGGLRSNVRRANCEHGHPTRSPANRRLYSCERSSGCD